MIRRLGVLLALAALLAAVSATPAGAHATLESTSPERGAELGAAPRQVTLRFSEPVEIGLGAVRVHDAAGREVQQQAAFHPGGEDRAVAVRLPRGLPDGAYTATYRVVSADSHPVSGGFVFAVGEAGAAPAVSVGDLLAGEGGGPLTSAALAALRGVQFGAIALAVGGFALLLLVWLPALAALAAPDPAWRSASDAFAARWRRALFATACIGFLSALLALPAQAAIAEGSSFWAGLGSAGDVLRTRFGTVYGLGALAWLVLLTLTAPRLGTVPAIRPASVGATGVAVQRSRRWGLALAPPLGLLVLLPALGGHAGIEEPVAVMLPANALHVLAASAWIGGIAMLLLALPAATRRLEPVAKTQLLTGTLGRFSTLALTSVAALLLGGILQSLLQLEALSDLVDSAYGRAILVKSGLVAILLMLGALNRQRILPALGAAARAGAAPGRPGSALRRSLQVEVALGAAALAVTGALAGYAPPGTEATGGWSGFAELGQARAELTVDPALGGPNTVELFVSQPDPGARRREPLELTMRASLPERDIAPLELDARRAGPDHYVVARAPLAPAGDWQLEVLARVSEFDEYRAGFEVPIGDG